MIQVQGQLRKCQTKGTTPVEYTLCLGAEQLFLNAFLGKEISLQYQGAIYCANCGRRTPKSYQQGYCFPCARKLARCDLCILKPHTCHYAKGTCREPQWGQVHCMVEHIVYLANTSGIKVGLTRGPDPLTRWSDQGAIQGMPIFRTPTRLIAGQVEMQIAKQMSDKTNWRVMLKGDPPLLDLPAIWQVLYPTLEASMGIPLLNEPMVQLQYPILEYPTKLTSLSFDTQPLVSGTLLGIKGQYLLLSTGVINIRKFSGYEIIFTA